MLKEGIIISRTDQGWKETLLKTGDDIQVGYYHILANDMNEAIAIAKQNPEFEYIPAAKIEVRPVKTTEETTNYVYPK